MRPPPRWTQPHGGRSRRIFLPTGTFPHPRLDCERTSQFATESSQNATFWPAAVCNLQSPADVHLPPPATSPPARLRPALPLILSRSTVARPPTTLELWHHPGPATACRPIQGNRPLELQAAGGFSSHQTGDAGGSGCRLGSGSPAPHEESRSVAQQRKLGPAGLAARRRSVRHGSSNRLPPS
jgi:hypothetical protein